MEATRKIKTKLTCVRYPGGKSNALKTLDPHFIKTFDEYREPFFGGGSVGLYLMQFCPGKKFWVNDFFYPVYAFWKVLHENPEELVKAIQNAKSKYVVPNDTVGLRDAAGKKIPSKSAQNGRQLHEKCRKLVDEAEEKKDEFGTACFWYILNKLSYSGMSMIGSYAPLAWDQNFTDACIANLPSTTALLKTVNFHITWKDYEELLTPPGDNVFVFLDPPYKIPHNLYGDEGDMHEGFDHKRFVDTIKKCSHKWMITYNEDDDLKKWFEGYHQLPWDLQYTMKAAKRDGQEGSTGTGKSGKKGKELLITNYPLNSGDAGVSKTPSSDANSGDCAQ